MRKAKQHPNSNEDKNIISKINTDNATSSATTGVNTQKTTPVKQIAPHLATSSVTERNRLKFISHLLRRPLDLSLLNTTLSWLNNNYYTDRQHSLSSHRPKLGKWIIAFKRFWRPIIRLGAADVFEKQREFNSQLVVFANELRDTFVSWQRSQKEFNQAVLDLCQNIAPQAIFENPQPFSAGNASTASGETTESGDPSMPALLPAPYFEARIQYLYDKLEDIFVTKCYNVYLNEKIEHLYKIVDQFQSVHQELAQKNQDLQKSLADLEQKLEHLTSIFLRQNTPAEPPPS